MEKRAKTMSRRKFSKEFKLAAVRRLEMGASMAEVARVCEISPNVLHRWRREFRDGVDRAFPGLGKKKAEESKVAELERKIGQQTLEIDFLKRVLQRVEEARMLQAINGSATSIGKSNKKPTGKRA
jgi:transposase